MFYACVKNGVVENVIVADSKFAEFIRAQWDAVVLVDKLEPRPGVGWTYDGSSFAEPAEEG
jgi:hypothetical protein